MANITIPNLPLAIALTGSEQVEVVQSNTSVRTTTQAIANLAPVNAITSLTINSPLYTSGSNPITSTGNIGLSSNGVTNNYLGTMPTLTLKGNNTGLTAAPTDLSVASVMTMLGAAPLLSPTFTGTPTAPTPATSDNSTQIATTAFVKAQTTASGTVTSVNGSGGTTGLSLTGGPITGAGTLTLGGTLGGASGGTGVNNGTNTITIAGNVTTVGAFPLTVTTTGTTSVTMPTTGTLTALGNATTGSGSIVLATSPVLVTPTLGAATATSVNGLTITSTTGGLTVASGKTLTASNSLALAGTDGSTLNVGTGGTLAALAFLSAAPAGTLTGSTLASGVTASSLTSVGTLGSLNVSGNVGIGTTTPGYKLQVAANTNGTDGLFVSNTSTGASAQAFIGVSAQGWSGVLIYQNQALGTAFISTADNVPMVFDTNNTERMRIDSSGNVGIGTTTPTVKLLVSGTNASGAITSQIQNLDTGGSSVTQFTMYHGSGTSMMFQAGSGYTAYINPTSTPMLFSTNSTERMRISAAGNVGIGTSNPDSFYGNAVPLAVVKNQNAATIFGVSNNTVGASATTQINIIGGTSNSFLSQQLADNNGSPFFSNIYGLNVNFEAWNFGGNERMRITAAGNVGIGTSTPDINLRVSGTYAGIGTLDGTVDNRLVSTSGGGAGIVGTYSNTPMAVYSNATERMRISAAGNVGIGTSNPTVALDVVGNISRLSGSTGYLNYVLNNTSSGQYKSGIIFQNSGTSKWELGVDLGGTGNQNFFIYDDVAGTPRFFINSSGNVGIGTISPGTGTILDVQSTTAGVRFPNMTTTQKTAFTPAAGTVVFDTTLAKLCLYTGAAWQTITSV